MYFSASELVKFSASKIFYSKLYKPEKIVTQRMLRGDKYANKIVEEHEALSEKRGIYRIDNNIIFFSIDMVKKPLFVEIKMVEEGKFKWFLEKSIIQSSFYTSMLHTIKTLDTPQFLKDEGHDNVIIDIGDKIDYQLWFGKWKFKVETNKEVLDFYTLKAKVIEEAFEYKYWEGVREFDRKYKNKEFGMFNINYKRIK